MNEDLIPSYIKNKHKLFQLFLIIYWLILFIATSLPSTKLPQFGFSDKLEHFIAYFILSVLLTLVFMTQRKYYSLRLRPYLYTILIVIFYAFLDELHQLSIPGRYCELIDIAADIVGGFLGVLFTYILFRSIAFVTAKSI